MNIKLPDTLMLEALCKANERFDCCKYCGEKGHSIFVCRKFSKNNPNIKMEVKPNKIPPDVFIVSAPWYKRIYWWINGKNRKTKELNHDR